MAQRYRSSRGGSPRNGSSRSGSSRGSSRGGGSRGRGGYGAPKKSNTGPTIAAVAVLALIVVGLVVAFGSGGDDAKKTKPDRGRSVPLKTTRFTPPVEEGPKEPVRLAPPEIAPEAKDLAKNLVAQAKELAAQGEALYQESQAAKTAGNDELWQEKLKEAAACYHEIMDAYNDLVGRMPTNDDWNEEQVANHYLGREASQINKYMSRLSQIRKQRRR